MHFPESYIPGSSEEWEAWLNEQERTNLEVYFKQPPRLIQDYNSEKETTRDYLGREIFELLQNANDAATEADVRGRVFVELAHDYLIVANTGEYFTIGGVNSLLFSHISHKKKRKNLIGQKGLGFRSILNWSNQPSILSGHLNLTYSDSKRQEIFERLVGGSEGIRSLVENESEHANEIIVPRLPFPSIIRKDSTSDNTLVRKLIEIRDSGYDTAIGIHFESSDYYEDAKEQLDSLSSATMLFAGSLDEISIRIDGAVYKQWKVEDRDSESNTTVIRWHDGGSVSWRTHRYEGRVEPGEIENGNSLGDEYSIVIAIPENNDRESPGPLFSFFPLEVEFPYPVFCHVSLELEGNRKHPRPSDKNQKILKRLALIMVEIAHQQSVATDPWARIRLLSKSDNLDKYLQDVSFEECILDKVKTCQVIPTLGDTHASPKTVLLIRAKEVGWLPKTAFPEVAISCDDQAINTFIDDLRIPEMPSAELTSRLNELQFFDINQRAVLIANLLRFNLLSEESVPDLLIDQSGKKITSSNKAFLQSRDQKYFDIPTWLNLQFVHEDLRIRLMELLGISEIRELRDKLDLFSVNEYSLASISSFIVAEANKRVLSNPASRAETYRDIFITMYCLYVQRGEASLPTAISVPLLAMDGSYHSARELYFSDSYSANGDWLSLLFKQKPEKLLTNAHDLGIDGGDQTYSDFLKWLGVADWPREVVRETVEESFRSYVIDTLPYGTTGIKLEEYIYKGSSDFNEPRLRLVKSMDDIDTIVDADPAAILVWLALDPRCSQWRVGSPAYGDLTDRPQHAQYRRTYSGPLPHHAKWKLENNAWLIVADGSKKAPRECMVAERSLEKIFPSPARFVHPLFERYMTDPVMFRRSMENAGVLPDISYLSRNEIVRILLSLPEKDPDGNVARAFYRSVLDRVNTDSPGWEEPPFEFVRLGSMWGKGPEGAKYYSVRDLRHADYEDFPEVLTSKIKIVDLPKKIGNQMVRRVFGVEPLDKKKILYNSVHSVEWPGASDLQVQFERAKPYLLGLRQSRSRKLPEVAALQSLKIVTCSSLSVSLSYESATIEMDYQKSYDYLLIQDRAYIYLGKDDRPSMQSSMFTHCVGEIVATTFNLENGAEFAQLIQCDEAERAELLRRMLGETDMPLIADLIRQPGMGETTLPPITLPTSPAAPSSSPVDFLQGDGGAPIELVSENEHVIQPVAIDSKSMRVSQEPHSPMPPPQKKTVAHRVSSIKPVTVSGGHRITDSNRCEELAEAFEVYRNRFPIRVSGFVGYNGPRCDILSFNSKESRDKFVNSLTEEKNINDVARFIEVKGSVNDRGAVDLKGNELAAARIYAENYFIYRVYEQSVNEYDIVIVSNPLIRKEALDEIVEISPERVDDALKYHVVLGEKL